jgi:hypothetical protein
VVEAAVVNPSANIPRVLLPAADPPDDAALAAVAEPLVSQAYVYLLRVVEAAVVNPSAKMPRVLLPTAELIRDAALAAAAVPLVSLA